MAKNKKQAINYKDSVFHLIKGKYFTLLLGLSVFLISSVFISTILIMNKPINKTKVPQEKKELKNLEQKKQNVYQVQDGEYLWQIAEKFYKDGNQWSKIAEYNRLPPPFYVNPGDKIIIP